MLKFLRPEDLDALALSHDARATIDHFLKCMTTKEYRPMVNPDTGAVGIAEMPVPTTENIEAIADEIREILMFQSVKASLPCRCAELFDAYEQLKASVVQDIKKHDVRQKELEKVEAEQAQRFQQGPPERFGASIDDPPCPYCHRYRPVPNLLAFSTKPLRQKVINLIFGGHVPLQYLVLFLSDLDKLIFNDEVIPESKKKQVAAFIAKAGILQKMEAIYQWMRGESPASTTSPPSSVAAPKPLPNNIGTTATTGDAAGPRWTPDLPPSNAPSITTNGDASKT